jgi:hypothetical protein
MEKSERTNLGQFRLTEVKLKYPHESTLPVIDKKRNIFFRYSLTDSPGTKCHPCSSARCSLSVKIPPSGRFHGNLNHLLKYDSLIKIHQCQFRRLDTTMKKNKRNCPANLDLSPRHAPPSVCRLSVRRWNRQHRLATGHNVSRCYNANETKKNSA